MSEQIVLGEITVEVSQKEIKNLHLSVYPPNGRVRISAPMRMNLDTIRAYTISKLDWIRKQQQKMRDQQRETTREYIDRESHYFWGERFLLKVVEQPGTPKVRLRHRQMILTIPCGTTGLSRQLIVSDWYRTQLKKAIIPLLAKWEPILGVKVSKAFVQHMKTKWGSCTCKSGHIRLNLELAKKPPECLEYIIVHELLHLIEPTHNPRFIALMNQHLPKWPLYRQILSHLPLKHEVWKY